jgi:hypothetical protein
MTENAREWNFEPPPGIANREVGLAAVLRQIRYDLSAAQGKLTEAMRMVDALDLGDELERTGFMNGPVSADHCEHCGVGSGKHAADCPSLDPEAA